MKHPIERFYIGLGLRVREVRAAQNMSQEALARGMVPRLTRAAIGNIEAGKQRVRAHTLWELARVLGISPGDLVLDESAILERLHSMRAVEGELEKLIPELSRERLNALSKRAVSRLVTKSANGERRGGG